MPNGQMMARGRSLGTAMGIPGASFTSPIGSFHCPVCGYNGPIWHLGPSPAPGLGGWAPVSAVWTTFGGGGGLRTHGSAYSPEFVATGLPSDEEITEMVYDAFDIDPLIPYDADLDVNVDAGVVTLSGMLPNKNAKHAAGMMSGGFPASPTCATTSRYPLAEGSGPLQENSPLVVNPDAAAYGAFQLVSYWIS